jgi:hypothetical protein
MVTRRAAHISGELLVTEAQQGGIFNEENVQRIFSFLFSFVFVPVSWPIPPCACPRRLADLDLD